MSKSRGARKVVKELLAAMPPGEAERARAVCEGRESGQYLHGRMVVERLVGERGDDALLGLKSSAIRLGRGTCAALWVFYGLAGLGFAAAGYLAGLAWPFWLGFAVALGQLAWQATRLAQDDPADCLAKFKSNTLFGWLLLAAIVAGRVLSP